MTSPVIDQQTNDFEWHLRGMLCESLKLIPVSSNVLSNSSIFSYLYFVPTAKKGKHPDTLFYNIISLIIINSRYIKEKQVSGETVLKTLFLLPFKPSDHRENWRYIDVEEFKKFCWQNTKKSNIEFSFQLMHAHACVFSLLFIIRAILRAPQLLLFSFCH